MRTLVSFILLIVVSPLFAGDNTNYEKAMHKALGKMNQAGSQDDFQQAANHFERIAEAEKDKWLPFYHASYVNVMMAAMETDLTKKDPYLDVAQKYLDAIEQLDHDASERLALQGFLIMIRMSVDPSRGMDLGQKCAMAVNQAYGMNNLNPRAVLMLGQFNHGSASYMGEDTSEACAMFDTTLSLFDETSSDKADPFSPNWGKEIAMMMQQQCQQ